MNECIFCKIGKGEIPSNKVYEDKMFLAFLDIRPLNKGHLLVIPKKHFRWIWNVDNFGKYFEVVKKVERGIEKALKPLRVLVLVFGDEVQHAHVHLVPRFENDGHSSTITLGKFKEISKEEMNKIAEEISKNI
ncbi:MAG: HIT family protein [Nanoarchaeota archaeon]